MADSTGALSETSATKLRKDLVKLAHDRVFPVVVETALFAIFTILVVTSGYIFWKRGLRHSRTNGIMLAATLAMYGLSTLDWAIDIRLLWNDLKMLTTYGLPGPHTIFDLSSPILSVVQGITSVICIIIGDSVVCWRVCVVWGNDRKIVSAALFWILGSLGVFTAWSVMFVGIYYPVPAAVELLSNTHNSVIVNAFAFSWSAATNVWATTMIGFKAWLQRRDLHRHLYSSTSTTVQKVLVLLVDLGIIYTIFMLLNVIVLIPSLNQGTFFSYVTLFMQQITGLYPTAIIVLVALQKSHLDHRFTYPAVVSEDTSSLPFTVNVQHATYASGMSAPATLDKRASSNGRGVQVIALHDVKRSASTSGMDSEFSATQWDEGTDPGESSTGLAR